MKKYFNLDSHSIIGKSIAYNTLKGKKTPVILNGEKQVFEVQKGFKGWLNFILSNNNKHQDKEIENVKQETIEEYSIELPPEDQDEYIPQDMEFGESMGESPHVFEIYPPLCPEFYVSGKKSYFDYKRLIWSKKKQLGNLSQQPNTRNEKYSFSGVIGKGLFSIPLPVGSLPDTKSLVSNIKGIEFKIDQNNCIYIESENKGEFAFDFYSDQGKNNILPIKEDSENIIHGKLTDETLMFLKKVEIQTVNKREQATQIQNYIQTSKKYNEKAQGELYKKSKKNNYFFNLDTSNILECYSANTLFVGLCRKIGIQARLVTGHMVASPGKNGKAHIGRNTGHAWSELWDEEVHSWIRYDATPTEKDNKEGSDGESGEGQIGGGDKNQGSESGLGKEDVLNEDKSAEDILQEMIKKVEQDELNKQEQELDTDLEQVKKTKDKRDLKKIKDNSNLTRKAQEILEDRVDEKILEQEKTEISQLETEKEVDQFIKKSLLDENRFRQLLKEYAQILKEKLEKERIRRESQMRNYGFSVEEEKYFKEYMDLERGVYGDIKRNISALEKLLPRKYKIIEEGGFRRGKIDKQKLKKHLITGETNIFTKRLETPDDVVVNMYETIMIDRSGSMGNFRNNGSPMREAIKAAIIRAKTLEYFKVEFSIIFFDTEIEEVMSFGDIFSSKKTLIPAKLMRAVQKKGGTDISTPLIHTKESMKHFSKSRRKKGIGNITFIGDGEPTDGLEGTQLTTLIDEIKKDFPITAFYITDGNQNGEELERYFGNQESGGTVVISSVKELSKGIISTFNKNIKKTVRKIESINNNH